MTPRQVAEVCFNSGPSNEYSGLISFRIDWFDLLADQGSLKSLLQHHRSNASILWLSAFFMVQLSDPNITAGNWDCFFRIDVYILGGEVLCIVCEYFMYFLHIVGW